MWGEVEVQLHFFARGYTVTSAPFVEGPIHLSSEWSGYPCQKSVNQRHTGLFQILNCIPLIYMTVFMPLLHYILIMVIF